VTNAAPPHPASPLSSSDARKARSATSPWRMPLSAWKAVVWRAFKETSDDNVGLVAAGVAFYGFLAMVPLLGALVLSYGLVAEPATVVDIMQALMQVMPADAAKLIGEQLLNVVETSDGKKGLGLLLALALALFGARNGAGAIITALNIAYEEKEKRGFFRVNVLALVITGCAVLCALLAAFAIALLAQVEALFPALPDPALIAGRILAYVALLLAGAAGAATLYRYAPSRRKARWIWISPGSLLVSVLWLCLTLGFGLYVANFGDYNATYGSLGAIVILLTWLYLSSYALVFGAELNSELERQTAQDTTDGPARAAGARGAAMADTVADGPHRSGDIDRGEPGTRKKRSRVLDVALMSLAVVVVWATGKPGDRGAKGRYL
jgi:membrane protein